MKTLRNCVIFGFVAIGFLASGCIKKEANESRPISDVEYLDSCLTVVLDLSHGLGSDDAGRAFPLTIDLIESFSTANQGARSKIVLSQISEYDQTVLFEGPPKALKSKFGAPEELKRFLGEHAQMGVAPVYSSTGQTLRYVNRMRDIGPKTNQVVAILGAMQDSETERSERINRGRILIDALKEYDRRGGKLALYLVHEDEVWRWHKIFELAGMEPSRYLISNRLEIDPELPNFEMARVGGLRQTNQLHACVEGLPVMPEPLFDLIGDLPRGRSSQQIGETPNAFFARPEDIAATQSMQMDIQHNKAAKLFLGVVGGQIVTGSRGVDGTLPRWVAGGLPVGVHDDRHHILVAGSRGTKGRAVLGPILATMPVSGLLCLDPKGDLASTSCRYRAEILQQEIAVTDAFNCSGSNTVKYRKGFNPVEVFLNPSSNEFTADALLIADAVVVENESVRDPHWGDCAREFIGGLSAHVATHPNYAGKRDLVTVWELANAACEPDPQDPNLYALEREMVESDAGHGFVRAAARAFYSRVGGEFSSVGSNVRRNLSFISIESIQNVLRGPSVDPKRLKTHGLGWYVPIPAMRDSTVQGFKRLIVQMSLAACESVPNMGQPQALFMLDEFQSLGPLRCLETAMAQFAGLGVKLLIVLQDFSQIQSIYPRSWQTFIANSGTLQMFSCNDELTLSYISKRLGEAICLLPSSQQPNREQAVLDAASGTSWAIGNKPLMTPSELEYYFARDDRYLRQLVLRPGYRPIILQRAFLDKHEFFRGRYEARAY